MAVGEWDVPVDPRDLLKWLQDHEGATTYEMKRYFHTNSKQIRISLGYLMWKNRIMGVGGQRGAVHYMLVTGKMGRPSPHKARASWEQDFRESQGLSTRKSPAKKKKAKPSKTEQEVEFLRPELDALELDDEVMREVAKKPKRHIKRDGDKVRVNMPRDY